MQVELVFADPFDSSKFIDITFWCNAEHLDALKPAEPCSQACNTAACVPHCARYSMIARSYTARTISDCTRNVLAIQRRLPITPEFHVRIGCSARDKS